MVAHDHILWKEQGVACANFGENKANESFQEAFYDWAGVEPVNSVMSDMSVDNENGPDNNNDAHDRSHNTSISSDED